MSPTDRPRHDAFRGPIDTSGTSTADSNASGVGESAAATAGPPGGGDSTELASMAARGVAQFVDVVVLIAIGGAIAMAAGRTTTSVYSLRGGPALLWFAILVGYFVVLEAWPGQTLGKRLLGIAVRDEDGGPAGLGAALVRNVVRPIDFAFLYVIGLVAAADSERKQRLGDRAADTIVVRWS